MKLVEIFDYKKYVASKFYTKDELTSFFVTLAKENLAAGNIFLSAICAFELFMILFTFISKKFILNNTTILYLILYTTLFLVSAFVLIVISRIGENYSRNYKIILTTTNIYACFLLIWSSLVSAIDYRNGGQLIVYMIVLLILPFAVYIRIDILFYMITANMLLFFGLITALTPNSDLTTTFINITTYNIITVCLAGSQSVTRVKNHINNSTIILQNNRLQEINRQLKITSEIDQLSGLYNRVNFQKMTDNLFNEAKMLKIPISFVMIDIDNFKEINDKYGHCKGDICIKKLGQIITESIADIGDSYAFRYGGEEFLLVLFGVDIDKAYNISEKIRVNLYNSEIVDENTITVSSGIYGKIPSSNSNLSDYINRSDIALYQSKKNGRNCTTVYKKP